MIQISLGTAINVHEKVSHFCGTPCEVRDWGLLESALARPHNHVCHDHQQTITAFDIAAIYADSIIRNHPFVDGNKRTGFVLAVLYIEMNGYEFMANPPEAAFFTWSLAEKNIALLTYSGYLQVASVRKSASS